MEGRRYAEPDYFALIQPAPVPEPRPAPTPTPIRRFHTGQRVQLTALGQAVKSYHNGWARRGTVANVYDDDPDMLRVKLDGHKDPQKLPSAYFEPVPADQNPNAEVPRPLTSVRPGPHDKREAPDKTDRDIFAMLGQGMKASDIAKRLVSPVTGRPFETSSVERRIEKIRAWRWATANGRRILSPEERAELLAGEERFDR